MNSHEPQDIVTSTTPYNVISVVTVLVLHIRKSQ